MLWTRITSFLQYADYNSVKFTEVGMKPEF